MLAGLVGMRGPAADCGDLADGFAGLELVRWACAGADCWAALAGWAGLASAYFLGKNPKLLPGPGWEIWKIPKNEVEGFERKRAIFEKPSRYKFFHIKGAWLWTTQRKVSPFFIF